MPNQGTVAPKITSCPYRVGHMMPDAPLNMIEERFDFQIGEGGKIERVSLGKFDLVKEVNSHNGEVGLINVIKLAQSRGIDPSTAFMKTEEGSLVDFSGIETLDDLIQAKDAADAKLKTIAKQYGISVDQLVETLKTGKLPETPKEEPKEGEK